MENWNESTNLLKTGMRHNLCLLRQEVPILLVPHLNIYFWHSTGPPIQLVPQLTGSAFRTIWRSVLGSLGHHFYISCAIKTICQPGSTLQELHKYVLCFKLFEYFINWSMLDSLMWKVFKVEVPENFAKKKVKMESNVWLLSAEFRNRKDKRLRTLLTVPEMTSQFCADIWTELPTTRNFSM